MMAREVFVKVFIFVLDMVGSMLPAAVAVEEGEI